MGQNLLRLKPKPHTSVMKGAYGLAGQRRGLPLTLVFSKQRQCIGAQRGSPLQGKFDATSGTDMGSDEFHDDSDIFTMPTIMQADGHAANHVNGMVIA